MKLELSIVRRSDLLRWKTMNRHLPVLPSSTSDRMPIQSGPLGNIYFFLSKTITPEGIPAALHPQEYKARVEAIIDHFRGDASAVDMLRSAFELAWNAHASQFRREGKPYIDHPIAVAEIRARSGLGADDIIGRLLHDVIEDGWIGGERITREYIRDHFNERIALIVDGVTELGKEPGASGEKPSLVDRDMKWLEYGIQDLGILVAKLDDRLHNMRTLAYMSHEKRLRKAESALKFYAKIADGLGMWDMKRELEDLSFKYTDPETFRAIEKRRNEIVSESQAKIDSIKRKTEDRSTRIKIEIKVIKEVRYIYEIHQRMKSKGISFKQLSASDIWRLNVVVPTRPDCHAIEGEIQDNLFPPAQDTRKNYIAEPRSNGHRFLHFYGKVPNFGRLLIQIRDREMQDNYHNGILAEVKNDPLWYKKGQKWLHVLVEDLLKSEGVTEASLYRWIAERSSPVVVYSPMGDRIELPYGSTVLDYAGQIDRELLLHVDQVYVDGVQVTPNTVLQHGQQIFITENKEVWPKLEWLRWMRTPDALETLRVYLRSNVTDRLFYKEAMAFFDSATLRFHLPAKELKNAAFFKLFMGMKGFDNLKQLLIAVGTGMIDADEFVSDFYQAFRSEAEKADNRLTTWPIKVLVEDRKRMLSEVIDGVGELNLNLANVATEISKKEKKARIFLDIECLPGEIGEIQRIQIRSIIAGKEGVEKIETRSSKGGLLSKAMKKLFKKDGYD